jgi:hypothetical protein
MRYPSAYKIEGKEFKDFKDLNDDQALKVVALIYNVSHEGKEDGIARSIALEEYLKLLAKRNSQYLKKSGIFDTKYDKVKISSWNDEELMDLYHYLAPKARAYCVESTSELTETQNSHRIICLIATNSVVTELKKRDITHKVVDIAGRVLVGALSIAASMI